MPQDEPAPSPADIDRAGWGQILRRSVQQFKHDDVTDRAAALTYFGVLAIFPGLLVLVSIIGLLGRSATQHLLDNLGDVAPGGVHDFLRSAIEQVQGRGGAATVGAVLGLLVAVWSASGYVAAFMRASNTIYEVDEGRPMSRTLPVRLGTTLALMLMLVASAVIVVATGSVATALGRTIGVGDTFVLVWEIVKWPVLLVMVSLMFTLLYWSCPNVKAPPLRWVTPGGAVAVVVWLAASGLFALYVALSGSYNKTYGSLATVMVFLVWLWVTNIAILLGLEFDAESQRQRLIDAGMPADTEPFVDVRDTATLSPEEAERVRRAAEIRDQTIDRPSGG